jgi:hypothetical protein
LRSQFYFLLVNLKFPGTREEEEFRSDNQEQEDIDPTQFRRPPRSLPYQVPFATSTLLRRPQNMDLTSEELHHVCKRFRVLIIGRRNAGKTTILEKMTGSEVGAKPEIRDKEGHLVVRHFVTYLISIVKLMVIG